MDRYLLLAVWGEGKAAAAGPGRGPEASRVEGPGKPSGRCRAEKARERLEGQRGLLGSGSSGEGWAEGPRGAMTPSGRLSGLRRSARTQNFGLSGLRKMLPARRTGLSFWVRRACAQNLQTQLKSSRGLGNGISALETYMHSLVSSASCVQMESNSVERAVNSPGVYILKGGGFPHVQYVKKTSDRIKTILTV